MSILNLIPETLGIVTSYLHQDDLAACFQVGNTRFMRLLLISGSITSLKLLWSRNRISAFLSSFGGLRKIELMMTVSDFGFDTWAVFPASLTRLELRNSFSLSCSSPIGTALPALRHLRLDITLDHTHQPWVATLPPTLETLEVWKFDNSSPLPASLTSLKVWRECRFPPLPLPSSLRIMALDDIIDVTYAEANLYLASLPSSLESLSIKEFFFQIDSSTLRSLPSGLTFLSLGSSTADVKSNPVFHASGDLITFPSGLNTLKIVGMVDMTEFAPLPSNLTLLGLDSDDFVEEIFFHHLCPVLPPGLLHLTLEMNLDDITIPFSLPKNLQTLHIDGNSILLSVVQSFPKSITSLNFPLLQDETDPGLGPPVPWPLQKLSFAALQKFRGPSHPSTVSLLHCLAIGCPNLSKIEFDSSSDLESRFCSSRLDSDYNEMSQSVFRSFSSLPPISPQNVVLDPSETVEGCGSANNEIHFLSGTATSVSLTDPPFRFKNGLQTFWALQCPFGDQMMSILPFSFLKVLGLPSSPFITNDHFTSIIQQCHHLERLICGSPNISGGIIAALPKTLSDLSLPNSTLITDDDMTQLPQTLTSLCLDSARLLTDAIGPSLPSTLRYISFHRNELISRSITHYLLNPDYVYMRTKKIILWILCGRLKILV